jgi:NADH:ubiquinone oxidoreductase subunit B-like Fe-S oxidoreductase
MVLLAIDNIPMHAWSPSMVHAFIGSACWNLEIILASTNRTDLSRFFVVAWAIHPDLIPNEVGFAIPEPEEPF